MRKVSYFAVFEENQDGAFGVFFPDIPGCISFGETLEEAQENVKQALELHVYGLEKSGEELPASSEKLDIEDVKNCIVIPISIYPDLVKNEMDNRRVRTNITIPSWLKDIAEENKVNYSRVLEVALMEYLEIPVGKSK